MTVVAVATLISGAFVAGRTGGQPPPSSAPTVDVSSPATPAPTIEVSSPATRTPKEYSPDSIKIIDRKIERDAVVLIVTAPWNTIFLVGFDRDPTLRCGRTVLKNGDPTRFSIRCPKLQGKAMLYASILDGNFTYTFEKPLF